MRDEFTCRSCARDTRRYPGVTVFDERSSARAFLKGLPREVVSA